MKNMPKNYIKVIIVLLFIISSMVLTETLTPKKVALMKKDIILKSEIPKYFASWKSIHINNLKMINSAENSLANKLYSQVLERKFINADGIVVFLSIAYGAEQQKDLLAHFPEVCYPAQGFNIDTSEVKTIKIQNKKVNIKQLTTQHGNRKEDVSYFVRVGKNLVATRLDQKWESLKYGMRGIIPDGLIFRVSTIGEDNSFQIHQRFMNDLFDVLDPEVKTFLLTPE